MFITRTEREIRIFYLDDNRDSDAFNDLLNNPGIRILSKTFLSQKETNYEGESSTVTERPYVRVEYEACSL